MKCVLSLTLLGLIFGSFSFSQTKPTILISGNGNLSINSSGQGVAGVGGGVGLAAGSRQTTVNKHDQTIEMAGDFLNFCPAVELTLSQNEQPDYFVFLNREGQPTPFGEIGQSQLMVLNRRKSVVFVVAKKATVKNAVKSACNAITADWQANGRLALDAPASAIPIAPHDSALPTATASSAPPQPATQAAPALPQQPKLDTVAIVLHTTASAEKYCKPETIASILSDTNAYVTSKGLILGSAATSKTILVLIVDRPLSKWVEITVQGRDGSGNVLWGEKVSDSGWGHLGTQGMLNTLEKVHQIIDARLK